MRTARFPKTNTRVPRQLRWWETLSAICILGTILVANVYALSWVELWPAASILGATLISLFFLVVGPVKTCVVGARSRRDFEDGAEAYISSLHSQLDDLRRELEELRFEMEQLRRKAYVNGIARKLTTLPMAADNQR
jgi:cell division protein FtsB